MRPPGDHIPCPRCASTNTIRLVSVHHCNGCRQSFTAFEVELTKRIRVLERELKRLQRHAGAA